MPNISFYLSTNFTPFSNKQCILPSSYSQRCYTKS